MAVDYFEPATYGDGVGLFVSKLIYTTPDVAIREMIANAKDQYLDPKTLDREHYKEIIIRINPIRRILKCIDYATGIEDLKDFKRFFAVDQPIKKVGTEVSTIQSPHDDMTGVFHVGKASFLKMSSDKDGEKVIFRSNNGDRGDVITMKLRDGRIGWDEGFRYPKEQVEMARKDIGLTVEVLDVVDELLKPYEVEGLISNWFGILIKRGLKVFVVNEATEETEQYYSRVEAPKGLDTAHEEHKTAELLLSTGKYISHCLKSNLKPKYNNIDVYVGYVKIKSIHVENCVEGWINCNSFQLNGARDGLQEGCNTVNYEGMEKFKKYIDANFDKQHGPEAKVTCQKDMNALLAKMLKAVANLFPHDPIELSGVADERSKTKGARNTDEDKKGQWEKLHNQKLTKEGGSDEPVKPIGGGHRGGGIRGGPGGPNPGIEEGGDHDVLKKVNDTDRPNTGPIKPNSIVDVGELGPDMPTCQMNTNSSVILNTDSPATAVILATPIRQRLAMLGPMISEAIIEHITKERPVALTISEYRKMTSDLYTSSLVT